MIFNSGISLYFLLYKSLTIAHILCLTFISTWLLSVFQVLKLHQIPIRSIKITIFFHLIGMDSPPYIHSILLQQFIFSLNSLFFLHLITQLLTFLFICKMVNGTNPSSYGLSFLFMKSCALLFKEGNKMYC